MFLAREEIRASWITISAGRLTIGSFLGSKIDHNRNKQERVLFLVARKRLETIELNTMNGREDTHPGSFLLLCSREENKLICFIQEEFRFFLAKEEFRSNALN